MQRETDPTPGEVGLSPSDTLHGFFEASVARCPENIAIEVPPKTAGSASRTFTYAEVEHRANALAATLMPWVGPESIVAILLERNDERVFVAQLAAMKAGGAYLCLDPSFPDERLHFTLGDARPVVVISEARHRARLEEAPPSPGGIIDIDAWLEGADLDELVEGYGPSAVRPEHLAYVIYTSGTTGQPKGVMVEHRQVANLLAANLSYFDLTGEDRVLQHSSMAYDSSIEETYLAFSAGGTLVIGGDEVIRMGPDLGDWLYRERISVFCPPPTLLRTIGGQAAAARLTALHLLYVGGEKLPRDVLEAWAPGRRLDNGYGPTECAITVCRTSIAVDDDQVTIGTPVANNTAWILDDALEEVEDGVAGELCIGGASISRGYLNRPALTAEKFHQHPRCGRIYRTGDLVRRLPDGNLVFLGRIDTQVKLRGYRIELTDIEAHACEFPGVGAVACTVQGGDAPPQLVAFVVAEPARPIDFAALRGHLAATLPPYMIPARFEAVDSLPRSSSGKLDRSALPTLERVVAQSETRLEPRTPLEAKIALAFSRRLGRPEGVSVDGDFFDFGGDSLRGAMLISDLRTDPETAGLTMRDLYERPTIAGLASRVKTASDDDAILPQRSPQPASVVRTHLAILASLLGVFAIGVAVAYFLGFVVLPWALHTFSVVTLVIALPIIGILGRLLWIPMGIFTAVMVKRVLIGRYTPGRHPVWGLFFLRHWLVTAAARLIPWGTIAGTEFGCMALRALGARVGQNVHLHKGVGFSGGGWDLLEIGDDVTLGRDAAIRLVDFESKELVVGPVVIGDGVTLETRAGVSAFTTLESGAYVTALSCVASGSDVPRDTRWHGIPGHADGSAPPVPVLTKDEAIPGPIAHGILFVLSGLVLGLAVHLPFFLATIGLVLGFELQGGPVAEWLFAPTEMFGGIVALLLVLAVASTLLRLPMYALFCRVLGPVSPGIYPRRGRTFMVIWFKDGFVESANRWLSGTLFWPIWLRWAGMKIGAGSEISTIIEVVPELVTVGEGCFFADGIYLGGPRMHRGHYTLLPVHFGDDTFLGNHAVIHGGTTLPSGILIGICTVAEADDVSAGTSWFGHPMFQLPRREVVEVDASLTHTPSWGRYSSRVFWETSRFALPVLPAFVMLVWLKTLLSFQSHLGDALFFGCVVPLYALALVSLFALVVLILKWVLLGRTQAGQHPLWSCWCSRWDFLYVVWGAWARPVMSVFEGTLLINAWLRLFGVRIGRRVFLGAGFAQVVDPDMLCFEDDATVVNLFQAHSFEDRVLKTAPIHIRRGATVRSHAVMLYGAEIGENAIIGEHSVIMKREHLRGSRYYVGAPTRPVKGGLVQVRPLPADGTWRARFT